MSDRGDYHEDEYESMDEYELLESLENEEKKSNRSSKSKIITIVGGLLLGAVAVFLFSDKAVEAPPPTTPKAGNSLPNIPSPETEKNNVATATPEVTKKESKPESVDERLAKLQQQNLIGEDLSAPGAIGENTSKANVEENESSLKTTAVTKKHKEVSPKPRLVKANTQSKPGTPTGKGSYAIKVMATPSAVQALDRRDKLEALGYKAQITKKGRVRQSLYSAETESFNSIGAAARQSQHFAHAGFQSKIAYVGKRKKVVLSLGSFTNRGSAEKMADRASKAGFKVKVKLRSEPQDLYLVKVGEYKTKLEAEQAVASLHRHGFSAIGVDTSN